MKAMPLSITLEWYTQCAASGIGTHWTGVFYRFVFHLGPLFWSKFTFEK